VFDNGAASAAGASAYFHITALDAGATVSLQVVDHSADNVTYVALLTSALAGTATGADRQATTPGATVYRYVYAGGTITNAKNATLAVAFHRG